MRLVKYYHPWFNRPLMRRDPSRLVDDFTCASSSQNEEAWHPPVDILETEEHIRLEIEAPGMQAEDIDVSVSGDTLSLSGAKRRSKDAEGVSRQRSERSFGSFTRSFKLLSPVDNEKVTADYQNGLLTITIPKAAAALRHDIKVETH